MIIKLDTMIGMAWPSKKNHPLLICRRGSYSGIYQGDEQKNFGDKVGKRQPTSLSGPSPLHGVDLPFAGNAF
jgi:hypothetical protein